jgi:dUTP pyrophosphatase
MDDASERIRGKLSGNETPDVKVRIRRHSHAAGLPLPKIATAGSSGADLAAAIDGELTIAPGARELVPTGFSLAIPKGFEGQVRPRSGLALRHGIVVPNSPGTIDADYRGEVKVILLNAGSLPFVIKRGDRIAQLVIAPVLQSVFEEVESLDETDRGHGGFGHSGT